MLFLFNATPLNNLLNMSLQTVALNEKTDPTIELLVAMLRMQLVLHYELHSDKFWSESMHENDFCVARSICIHVLL